MSRKETVDIEFELTPVDPEALFDQAEVAQEAISAGPISSVFPRIRQSLGKAKTWASENLRRSSIIFLVIILTLEIVGRVAEPRLLNRVYDERTTAGYPVSLNQDGYRGPAIAATRPPNSIRLLTLGDSVTFGTGVATESTWPESLAGRLHERSGIHAEVINLSVGAADLRQLGTLLDRYGESHAPDVAVLMLTGNMVSLAWIRDGQPPKPLLRPPSTDAVSLPNSMRASARKFAHSFALPGILMFGMEYFRFVAGLSDHLVDPDAPYGIMLAHGIRQNTLPRDTAEEAWAITRSQLDSIQQIASKVNVPLIAAYAPPRFTLSDQLKDNLKLVPTRRFTIDPLEKAASICAELGIPFVRIDEPLRSASDQGEDVYVLADYTHFDGPGHRAVAEVLAKSVSELIAARAPIEDPKREKSRRLRSDLPVQ
jgi:lysophospholipase L1-like esterase